MKQREVTELLARADDLAVQNKSYQEVYAAMAQSLSEAWVDLNKQLDYRKMLLDQSINFHESALQVLAVLLATLCSTIHEGGPGLFRVRPSKRFLALRGGSGCFRSKLKSDIW